MAPLLLLLLLAACSGEPNGDKVCPRDQTRCDGVCVQTDTDTENCGACGVRCGPEEMCRAGACTGSCDEGLFPCGSDCVDPFSDPDHCGACGHACAPDEVCSEGRCGSTCADGLSLCGRSCLNLWSDVRNCGSCGLACEGGQRCVAGACTCDGGKSPCLGGCVDLQSDAAHCGACGVACAGPHVASGRCEEGACVLFCETGRLDCDGEMENGCEVDAAQDAENCGACGNVCGEGLACVDGACACPPGTSACDGECVDLQNDPRRCGSCSNDCFALTNVVSATCAEGSCALTCLDGWGACGEGAGCTTRLRESVAHCGVCGKACQGAEICDAGTCFCPEEAERCGGVCTATLVDVANCGACGNDCRDEPNVASAVCTEGACVPTCVEHTGDCDSASPGCETDLLTDPSHCGACGVSCRADQICAGGSCICPEDHLECDGLCRPVLTDPAHCGSCGTSCIDQPNAVSGQCVAGGCVFVCQQDFEDCDPTTPGCETHLPSDPAHCGACGDSCRENDACVASECVCPPDKTDCGSACTDLEIDERHCGACNFSCDPGQICEEFTCYAPCPNGQNHCGGVCFDLQTTAEHCGSCQMDCTALPQVEAASCVDAACVLACQDGWTDCNGESADGCEIHLETDPLHCGACGRVCPSEHHCAGGDCVCDDPDLTSCDGRCVDAQRDLEHCGACGNGCAIRCEAGACVNVAIVPKRQGDGFTMAVDTDGKLYLWGKNNRGQLGNGNQERVLQPAPIDLPAPVVSMASGSSNTVVTASTCAALANGEVYCWGDNSRQQAGAAATSDPQLVPVPILLEDGETKLDGAAMVASSSGTFCAVVGPQREAHCWGSNVAGMLGYSGTPTTSPTPRKIPHPVNEGEPLRDVEQIIGGEAFFCALVTGGEVYCWGNNAAGQFGSGTAGGTSAIPVQTQLRLPAVDLAASYQSACAVLTDGKVDCWGRGRGLVGSASSEITRATPVTIAGISDAIGVTMGFNHACAWSTDGAWCWGSNASGQLGTGQSENIQIGSGQRVMSAPGEPMSGIQSISVGSSSSCALSTQGVLRCWGLNGNGQIGLGHTDSPVLHPVSPLW